MFWKKKNKAPPPPAPINREAIKLADRLIAFFSLTLTSEEREAIYMTVNVIMREHPWIMTAPVMKMWLS